MSEIVIKNGTVRWLEKDGFGKKKVWEANAERLYKLLKEHFEPKVESKKKAK